MIDDTINDDKTIAGGGKGAILAGRYKAFRRPGRGEAVCPKQVCRH